MNSPGRAEGSAPRPIYTTGSGHRGLIDERRESSSSTGSGVSTASYHDVLLKTLSSSPKGSKAAEDAARAMLMAERKRLRAEKGKGKAVPEPEPAQIALPLSPKPIHARNSSLSSVASSIGQAFLKPVGSPESLAFEFDDQENDFDSLFAMYTNEHEDRDRTPRPPEPVTVDPNRLKDPLIRLGYHISPNIEGGPRHPALTTQVLGSIAPIGPPPSIPLPEPPLPRHDPFDQVPWDQNAIGIFWRGTTPQIFGLISYTSAESPDGPEELFNVEVMGKTTQVIEVPPYWTGRVQKMSGTKDEPATHAEVMFNGFADMTFFKVSYVNGNNGPAIIRSRRRDAVSGSPFKALQVVPNHLTQRTSTGAMVIKRISNRITEERLQLIKFYKNFLERPDQGQVDPGNERATAATHDKQVTVEFY